MPHPQAQSWLRSRRSSARVCTGDKPEKSTPGRLSTVFQSACASSSAAPMMQHAAFGPHRGRRIRIHCTGASRRSLRPGAALGGEILWNLLIIQPNELQMEESPVMRLRAADSMRSPSVLLLLLIPILCCPPARGAQFRGSVRAADQPVPGATVTATKGDAKVTAFTDESGRYAMELAPGEWSVRVEMFEFTPAAAKVTVGDAASARDWVLNMPKLATRNGTALPITPLTAVTGNTGSGEAGGRGFGGRGGRGFGGPGGPGGRGPGGGGRYGGRGGAGEQAQQANNAGGRGAVQTPNAAGAAQPQPGFQSATARPTEQAQPAAADADSQPEQSAPADLSALDEEAFLVNGSVSGGLGQSSDDETRRKRMMAGRGGPGGPADRAEAAAPFPPRRVFRRRRGFPPGMTASLTNDSLGLGGFGASAINGGFDVGPAAGGRAGGAGRRTGGGAPAARRRRRFGGGGAGGGGGGGGGRGGRGGGRGGGGRRPRRGRAAGSIQRPVRQLRKPAAHHSSAHRLGRYYRAELRAQCRAVFAQRASRRRSPTPPTTR